MGYLNFDKATTDGMISILDNYHQYVPNTPDRLYKLILYGDGLSVERVNDAQMLD